MFPLCQLIAHAELSKSRSLPDEVIESRRCARRAWPASLMLYPQVEREEPTDLTYEEPTVVASLSNVSRSGMGLVHEEPLPPGTVFEVDWEHGDQCLAVALEVVHSRQIAPRMYRTGARVVSDQCIPIEVDATATSAAAPAASAQPTIVRVVDSPATATPEVEPLPLPGGARAIASRVMRIDAPMTITAASTADGSAPAPAGTLRVSPAGPRFATTQRVPGASPCGFDRHVEVCRVGAKLWIYIHSPGKKNGWGIYVDPGQFDAAMAAVREQISHPTITALAA